MLDTFLEKLETLSNSPCEIKQAPNVPVSGDSPHIHVEWEVKFFTDHVELVPPRTVHSSSYNAEFKGGILLNGNEIELSGWGSKFPITVYLDDKSTDFEALFAACIALPESEKTCRTELAKSIFSLLKNELSYQIRTYSQVDIVQKVADYLERHYFHCDLSISEIAEHTGYTQQYLNKKFKEKYNCSIQQELIRIRMRHAQELLLGGHYLVADVARLTGWSNAFYFSNVYHKFYGYSPSNTHKFVQG